MNSRLHKIVSGLKRGRIVVVGDLILDRYIHGSVERISPEAPAQILDVSREEELLGGAANVAANISAIGAKTFIFGVVGKDQAGVNILKLLKERGIVSTGLVSDADRSTTIKSRYMSLRQQILRVDKEQRSAITKTIEKKLIARLIKILPKCDGIVISDYGKGTLTDSFLARLIELGKKAGKPVIVDPKGDDYRKYKGVTLITPNKKEACGATGIDIKTEEDYATAAEKLFSITSAQNILITRGDEGMSLFCQDGKNLHLPAEALEVFDVSGAGDTVTAAIAVFFCGGVDLALSARIANVAASIEVAHVGAKAVSENEILEKLGGEPEENKIITVTQAEEMAESARQNGLKVVFTNGCFDILHAGHVDYLEKARSVGDLLIVGLNSDSSIKKIKGTKRPIVTQIDRAALLAGLSSVSAVVIFGEPTPAKLIKKIKPDILAKGGDWKETEIVGGDFVKKRGGEVLRVKLTEGVSSTGIIETILERYGNEKKV